MRRGKKRLIAACLTLLGLAAGTAPCRAKIGLSSQFVNVVLENLKPGGVYNIREIKGVPYTIKNRGDDPAEVLVEVIIPPTAQLRAPYEPIPDPTWIQVNPSRMRIGAGEMGFSDLIISVPNDEKLRDRHFWAQLWGHTLETGLFAVGVKTEIRFSIGKGPATLAEEKRRKAMVDLNYDLWPSALYVKNARTGPYDVKKEEKRSFKITNRAEKAVDLVFKAVPWQSGVSAPQGYEKIEDLGWVKFSPDAVSVEPDSVQDIRLLLDVPEAMKGRKVAFLVQVSLPIGVVVGASHQVYVEVPAGR
ncbi:MAG: hypothetical protein AAB576_03295 [Elusimicrobiota bacterium]